MLVLFLKATINHSGTGHLFETNVDVRGHTTKTGIFVRPYAARRKKRPAETATDLFAVTMPMRDSHRTLTPDTNRTTSHLGGGDGFTAQIAPSQERGGDKMQFSCQAADARNSRRMETLSFDFDPPPAGWEHDPVKNALTWTNPPADVVAKTGVKTLTGGRLDTAYLNGNKVGVITFDTTVGGQPVKVVVNDKRPSVQAANDWLLGLYCAERDARNAYWGAARARRETEAKAQVPEGFVYLQFLGAEEDGAIESYRTPDGAIVKGVELAGGARAVGPGDWAYATPEAIQAAIQWQRRRDAKHRENAEAIQARRDAYRVEQAARVVPDYALASYKQYRGDADAAWEAEDETAYGVIRAWADAIKIQGLAQPTGKPPRPDDLSEVPEVW